MTFSEFKSRYQRVPVEEYPNSVRQSVPDPVLSVHIVTYQHADYIRDAIESVLMQDVSFPIEIIIGDDESSDGTREICKTYAEENEEIIRLIQHKRENNIKIGGKPSPLFQYWYNMMSLRGEYFALLSGDDKWNDEKKLEKQVSFLQNNESYSLTFHDSIGVNKDGTIIENSLIPTNKKENYSKKSLMCVPDFRYLTIAARNVFSEVPERLVECFNEDAVTSSILGQYGNAKYIKGIKPAHYRIHSESMMNSSEYYYIKEYSSITYYRLSKYYKNKEYELVSRHHKEKYFEKAKMYFFSLVSTDEYYKSFKKYTEICSNLIADDMYKSLFKFSVKSIRFLVGKFVSY